MLTQNIRLIPVFSVEETDAQEDTAGPEMLLEKWMVLELKSERPPDYLTFRNLLWKAMTLFPEKCEPKSRDIVPLFLAFLE